MFSDNAVKKLFKKADDIKIGKKAINIFRREIKKYSFVTAKKAVKNARHLGRKVVRAEDVKEIFNDIERKEYL